MPTARGRAGEPAAAAVLRGATCTRSSTPAMPTRRCGATSATAGSARCCRTSSRTATAADRRPAEHKVAVLENDVLRATFLLDLGGRLWSLGAQAHRSRAAAPEPGLPAGEPRSAQRVVRRRRGVEHRDHRSLAHHLRAAARRPRPAAGRHAGPADVRVRAVARGRLPGRRLAARGLPGAAGPRPDRQPQRHRGTPIYWWSNVAVPQSDDVRVLAPADAAWQFSYDRRLRRVPIPVLDGRDRTYPTRAAEAADYFFEIDDDQRRWIAALDGRGTRTGADLDRPASRPQALPVGKERRAATTGRSGSPGRARSTSRSRRAWPAPSSSTCRCRHGRRGPGSRRTDCSRATRTPSTAADWSLARRGRVAGPRGAGPPGRRSTGR